ncbi:hypothetical protein TSMEX_009414 [Taenia solium]|eukprot:TsM_000623700 transcript=TsM_000623700 gene=TsM_000623700
MHETDDSLTHIKSVKSTCKRLNETDLSAVFNPQNFYVFSLGTETTPRSVVYNDQTSLQHEDPTRSNPTNVPTTNRRTSRKTERLFPPAESEGIVTLSRTTTKDIKSATGSTTVG